MFAFLLSWMLALLAAPFGAKAEAQTLSRAVRVGVLVGGIPPTALRESAYFLALRDALSQLGYREGQNLAKLRLKPTSG